jgi:diadenosine tetraphosphate (Ap4A) HIT family hydrolase
MTCLFCSHDRQIIAENEHAFAIADGYPMSLGHSLVIPKRHVSTVFDLSENEYAGCFSLVRTLKAVLEELHETNAFNIGVNCGVSAGQTIEHAHIHLIPRYKGDVEDPRGGIRHLIPGKGYY